MRVSIRGLQEAQRANLQMIAAVRPSGGLGRAVQYLATQGQRYAVSITHVDTGALKATHRIEPIGAARYRIYIGSGNNPRSGTPTAVYGPYEHNRGGSHAFYERTVYEAGADIGGRALMYLQRELP